MSLRILKQRFPEAKVKRVLFKDYHFELTINQTTYHIKMIPVSNNTILTINSKHIWNIKRGRPNGLSFKTGSSSLLYINEFNKLDNKIAVFKSKPYKILKYLNEADIIDISNSPSINDIMIFNSVNEVTIKETT